MNPDNAIAVRAIEVDNANLYFSSWISFAAAVFCEYIVQKEKRFSKDV